MKTVGTSQRIGSPVVVEVQCLESAVKRKAGPSVHIADAARDAGNGLKIGRDAGDAGGLRMTLSFCSGRSRTLRVKSKSNARVPVGPAGADENCRRLATRTNSGSVASNRRVGMSGRQPLQSRRSRRRESRARAAARNSCLRRRARSCGTSEQHDQTGQRERSTRSKRYARPLGRWFSDQELRCKRDREEIQPDIADPRDHHVRQPLRPEQLIGKQRRERRASRSAVRRSAVPPAVSGACRVSRIDRPAVAVRPAARRRGARCAQSRKPRRRAAQSDNRRCESPLGHGIGLCAGGHSGTRPTLRPRAARR